MNGVDFVSPPSLLGVVVGVVGVVEVVEVGKNRVDVVVC